MKLNTPFQIVGGVLGEASAATDGAKINVGVRFLLKLRAIDNFPPRRSLKPATTLDIKA